MWRRPARLGGYAALLVILAVWAAGSRATQDSDGEARLKEASEALLPHFAAAPRETFRDRFADSFLRDVGAKKLEDALKDVFNRCGKATQVRLIRMTGPFDGEVEFVFEKGFRVPAAIRVESRPPFRITGFQLFGALKENDTLGELMADLRDLPGKSAFSFTRLAASRTVIWEHNDGTPLAVGSCFKLMLLATMADEVDQGKRSWQDTVKLQRELISMPSGIMQDWPLGAPVTLHTLATLMISKSDNTAADHLFHLLGRQAIEEMQKKLGLGGPERNRPFLSAGEFFRIKHVLDSAQQKEYVDADQAGRRKLLDTLVKQTPLSRTRTPTVPQLLEHVEWHFTTSELCRVLDWLRQHDKAGQAREILGVGRGLPADRSYWPYLGYKAGAEPGVVCFTLLLQDKAGTWFALAIAWNDAEKDVDYTRLIVFTQRLLRLAQRQQVK